MKKRENTKLIFLIVFSFVIGGVIMFALLKWTPLISEVLGTNNTVVTRNDTQVYEKNSLAAAVDKVYDAVVMVSSYENDSLVSTGSGFVYKTDNKYGYILTNQHVVGDASKVTVTMSNDTEAEATILGGDEYLDLAVLRIDKSNVTLVANIGDSEDMKLGDTIFTVGTPMGEEYQGTVTYDDQTYPIDIQVVDEIANGNIVGTVLNDSFSQAKAVADLSLSLFNGNVNPILGTTWTLDNNKSVRIHYKPITLENLDEIRR